MNIAHRAIPVESTVVVIGANGYMAIETCEKVLEAGYRLRGTVRDVKRNHDWMHRLFDDKWPGKFELVQVPDFLAAGAFDKAFEGAAGVIFPSMPMLFDSDSSKVIEPMIKGVINTLEAADRAGVKRYVLSSSSKAVHGTIYNKPPVELTTDMFNHNAIETARNGSASDTSLQRIVGDQSYAPKPIARAEDILREIGRPGFTSEDDVIRDFIASMFP